MSVSTPRGVELRIAVDPELDHEVLDHSEEAIAVEVAVLHEVVEAVGTLRRPGLRDFDHKHASARFEIRTVGRGRDVLELRRRAERGVRRRRLGRRGWRSWLGGGRLLRRRRRRRRLGRSRLGLGRRRCRRLRGRLRVRGHRRESHRGGQHPNHRLRSNVHRSPSSAETTLRFFNRRRGDQEKPKASLRLLLPVARTSTMNFKPSPVRGAPTAIDTAGAGVCSLRRR